MTTFDFDLSKKELDGASAIFKFQSFLLHLLGQRMKEDGMTRKDLAAILELDKSTVSKMLRTNQNLTERTFGEIVGALDFDFDLVPKDLRAQGKNHRPTIVTAEAFRKRDIEASGTPRPLRSDYVKRAEVAS